MFYSREWQTLSATATGPQDKESNSYYDSKSEDEQLNDTKEWLNRVPCLTLMYFEDVII